MAVSRLTSINHVKKLRDFIFDLLFPVECVACGRDGSWLCPDCFRGLPIRDAQSCLHCKQPNKYGEFCPACRQNYHLNGVWIAGDYENKAIASVIKNLKYRLVRDLAPALGEFAGIFLRNLLNRSSLAHPDLHQGLTWRKFSELKKAPSALLEFNNNLLIPVPLHKSRQRFRGFNQAEAIGRAAADNLGLKCATGRLIRIKKATPQAKLSERERWRNVQNCFAWNGDGLGGTNIILVDDVATTGATLNECAMVLKNHGAGEVWGLVIAKG